MTAQPRYLFGFTDKRGNSYGYHAETENPHYPGAVPVDDVLTKLFHWEPLELPVQYTTPDGALHTAPDRKVIVRSDTFTDLGVFRNGYRPHPYGPWLVDNLGHILDSGLDIASAWTMKGGARAVVQVEMPENFTSSDGVEFRPSLNAATSFDGSTSTIYKRSATMLICDNQVGAMLGGEGQEIRIRHSRNSLGKLSDVRAALDIIHSTADAFAAEVDRLTALKITDAQFENIVNQLDPLPSAEDASARALTMAEQKREGLWDMWRSDERVTPWAHTGFGVFQAYNTWRHHSGRAPRSDVLREERNMLRAVDGTTAKGDLETLEAIYALS